jgi:amino acid transporter
MAVEQQLSEDEKRLAELGYKQELKRRMSWFSNFAVSFTIISILSGCITTYYLAMDNGGPIVMTTGWLFVGIFVLLVSMAMAEICSVYPTAGGLYYWAARLATKNKRQWAWGVGWFNWLGEVAVTAAIDYGGAITMAAFLNLTTGFTVTPESTFLLFVGIIVVHGLLNTFGVNLVKLLSDISAWWHVVGVLVILVVLAVTPDHHNSVSWTLFHVEHAGGGWASPIYAVLIGLLLAQYTFTGFDASAHIAEETHEAHTSAPRGIVTSVWVSLIAGFLLLYAVTSSIQDYAATRATETGLPPAQVFIDAAGDTMGKFLLFICLVAQMFCGMASVTANSRMTYAFCRDNALPGSRLWKKVNPRTGTPTNSIWLCVAASLIITIPAAFNTVAFFAVTSIAVIGLYIAYATPTFLKLRNPDWAPGEWNLGRYSKVVGWTAVGWVVFIVILFMLPQYKPEAWWPIDWKLVNYAPVAVIAVALFAFGSWHLGGKKHFMLEHDDKAGPAPEAVGEVTG